ncbi:MAG TPA: hypothetical protein VGQ56_06515 [Gemmatimonadaceae bacterium]|jgi:hypothetical protein|nr:hypothetical protein [Gemmatimonadaceae bacterium]
MTQVRLDATGINKLKALDDALLLLQRINGLVEQYALALKRQQPASVYVQNVRRQLPTLAENLRSHFGSISDIAIAVNLAASRGASEVMRLRVLREGVAQIRQAMDIAIIQTKAKHAIEETDQGAAQSGES